MTLKGKAVVHREFNQPVRVEEVEFLPPRGGEVMIKVAACGVCHSDLSATNGTIPTPTDTVLGHEAAGTVIELGEGVSDLAIGDHVVVSWIPMCGACRSCVAGRPWLCDNPLKHGPRMPDGTSRIRDASGKELNHFMSSAVMAEYATLARSSVIKIDEEIPLASAALVGCAVTTGVGAVVNTAKVEPGSTVAVIGTGGIGLNVIQGAALSGARAIVAIDMADDKLEHARVFGATHVVNPSRDGDPVDVVKKLIRGGVDYAFECIGLSPTVVQAFHMLRKGGTAVVVGIAPFDKKIELPTFLFPVTEKCLTGSMYGSSVPSADFPKFIALYQAKKLKLEELISARYSIDDVHRAFEDMSKNARGVIVFE
jgi:Zn-dependent alcohol dehydrogenase